MTDPYQVLGVDRSASDDEIKKAYRSLSRRYHPDANVNNPNKAQAEERFKQVQAAYDQIMKERRQGFADYSQSRSQGYGSSSYGRAEKTRGYAEQSPLMQAAMRAISNRRYAEAVDILNAIPAAERKGLWYYYSALANEELGNKAAAIMHIRVAVALEPGNIAFLQYRAYLEKGASWYEERGRGYGSVHTVPDGCANVALYALFCSMFRCCFRL